MPCPRPREQICAILEPFSERVDHFRAHLVTTWTSGSTDRDEQVFGPRSVFIIQPLNTGEHCARQRPAPARVHRRKRARHRIAKQDRHTIRRLHACQNMPRVTDDHVAINSLSDLIVHRLRFLGRIHDADVGAMDLPAARKGPLTWKKLEKAAAILQNVLRSIVVEPREAQRIRGHIADAAKTRGKAVYESVILEGRTDQGAHAVELAPVESMFG